MSQERLWVPAILKTPRLASRTWGTRIFADRSEKQVLRLRHRYALASFRMTPFVDREYGAPGL